MYWNCLEKRENHDRRWLTIDCLWTLVDKDGDER